MYLTDKLSKIEEKFLVFSLMLTTGIVFLQVIMRYVVKSSLSWSEELTRYIFLWQIWVGASYAISANKHLKIDVFVNRFQGGTKKTLQIISLLLWIFFSIFLAVKGTELVLRVHNMEQLSTAMQIPMEFPYCAIPAGGILMVIKLVHEFKKVLKQEE